MSLKQLFLVTIFVLIASCEKEEVSLDCSQASMHCEDIGWEYTLAKYANTWNKCYFTYYIEKVSGSSLFTEIQERQAYKSAFETWGNETGLVFSEVNSPDNADIKITFDTKDGKTTSTKKTVQGWTNTLYSLTDPDYKTNSTIHFDIEEDWTLDNRPDGTPPIDLKTIALHEIGHALGLCHSSNSENLMHCEYIGSKGLHNFDIKGIKAIYEENCLNLSSSVCAYCNGVKLNVFIDPRGGQNRTYLEIPIGNQIWMLGNLNYKTENSHYSNSSCIGTLYTLEDALTACPPGWHLPSDEEWKTLERTLGMSEDEVDLFGMRGNDIGSILTQTPDITFVDPTDFCTYWGNEICFFARFYGYGYLHSDDSFSVFNCEETGYFWSSTPNPTPGHPFDYIIRQVSANPNATGIYRTGFPFYKYASCRCVKD